MATQAQDFGFETGNAPFVNDCASTPPPVSANFCTISFPLQNLSFAQPGRSYLVTATWDASQGSFAPSPLRGVPAVSKPSDWSLEESNSGPNKIAWVVYIPSNAGTAYTALSLSVLAKVFGYWSRPDNLAITPTWNVSAPIP